MLHRVLIFNLGKFYDVGRTKLGEKVENVVLLRRKVI